MTMPAKIKTFKDLIVWQKSIELVKIVYQITGGFPREEQFSIVQQMKRAAVSIPSNIAEGFKRGHAKEHKQFLNIALGSCAELETQIIISRELGFIDQTTEEGTVVLLNYIAGMLVNLSKKIDC